MLFKLNNFSKKGGVICEQIIVLTFDQIIQNPFNLDFPHIQFLKKCFFYFMVQLREFLKYLINYFHSLFFKNRFAFFKQMKNRFLQLINQRMDEIEEGVEGVESWNRNILIGVDSSSNKFIGIAFGHLKVLSGIFLIELSEQSIQFVNHCLIFGDLFVI